MKKAAIYLSLTLISVVMLYPLLWLIGASFKTNSEIFGTIWFMPESFDFSVYKSAEWRTVTPYSMGHYFLNTFMIIVPKTVFAVFSSVLVAYGFARFDFPMEKAAFRRTHAQYAHALDSFGNAAVSAMEQIRPARHLHSAYSAVTLCVRGNVACSFSIQFFKSVPKELDEAPRAKNQTGCGTLRTLIHILVPCIRPAIVSITVFTFLWTMNDFLMPLIMIQSVQKYPLSLALRLSVDSTGQGYEQRKIIAMSVIGPIPSDRHIRSSSQKKFIGGITAGGISG